MPSKKPRGILGRDDGDEKKRFPNGLRATIKSIRKFWPRDIHEGGRDHLRFAQNFLRVYNSVARRYGHEPDVDAMKATRSLASKVYKLEGSGDTFLSDITFYKMRAFAELVGVPTSMFLVFAQCVSYDAQGKGKDHVLRFLDECRSTISALQDHVNRSKEEEILYQPMDQASGGGYLAKLAGLRAMRDSYSRQYVYSGIRDKPRATPKDGA